MAHGYDNFIPDYDVTQSIQRLREEMNIQAHDLMLIRHESMEYDLMKTGMTYDEARELTNKLYNYEKALDEWMDEKSK